MSSEGFLTLVVACWAESWRLRAECLVSRTGQVLALAWPGVGGGHWIKALDERAPMSLGLWSGPEGLVVLQTTTTVETLLLAALAQIFLSLEGLEAFSSDGVMSPEFQA